MPGNTPTERIDVLSEKLSNLNISQAIISDPRHIFYFSGFSTSKPRLNSLLIVDCSNEKHLLLVGQSESELAQESFSGEIKVYSDYDIDERMIAQSDYFSKSLHELAIYEKTKPVGFEDWHLPQIYLSDFESKKIGISNEILAMRRKKGLDEQTLHLDAARRIDKAYEVARQFAKPGRTEIGLFHEMNSNYFGKEGDPEFWQNSIVSGDFVSGKRSLKIGGLASRKKLLKGETLIMDIQTMSNYYWADTARTFVVGLTSRDQKEVFEVLMNAKRAAEKILRPGSTGSQIYNSVSQVIEEAGFEKLPHHAGHGVGLDGQEAPFFLPNSQDVIEEGDIVAVEPGIYATSAGGMRIEDNYIITNNGFKKTSRYPMSLT